MADETTPPQEALELAASLLRQAALSMQRPDMREAADAICPPRVRTFRATHMVLTPGHPPLYCLREDDALRRCEERATPSEVHLCTLDRRTGQCSWGFWRMAP